MAEVKYGKLKSWDDGSVGGNDFVNLVQGSNKVRVFTNPYQFVVHWVNDSSGANRKIKCAIENCPLCKQGVKAQYRWYLGIIDRKTQNAGILEISTQVYLGIKNLVSNPDWGDVRRYDVDIKRGAPKTNPLYTVMPSPKTLLTDDEKACISEFLERVDIAKFTQPMTPEEIAEKLGTVIDEAAPKYAIGTETVTNTSGKPNISEDDFNFEDDM